MSAAPSLTARPRPDAPPSRSSQPRLRVVGRPRHTVRYVVLLTIVGALGVFGVVSLNALAAEAAFEARTLESEVAELSAQHDELTVRVASLEAPERVREVAVGELGMVPAEQAGFVLIDSDTHAADAPADQVLSLRP